MAVETRIKLTNLISNLPGEAIDFTAQRLGMTHDRVFRMRHKILGSLARLDDLVRQYLSPYFLTNIQNNNLHQTVCF